MHQLNERPRRPGDAADADVRLPATAFANPAFMPSGGLAERPITSREDDRLGRSRIVEALSALLRERQAEGGLSVGIFGEPGSGKSSVLHMLRAGLLSRGPTVWIDAWEHTRARCTLWRKLLFVLVEALGDDEFGLPAAADTEFRRAMLKREFEELAAIVLRGEIAERASSLLPGSIDQAPSAGGPGGADAARRPPVREGGELEAALERRQQRRLREELTMDGSFRARFTTLIKEELGTSSQPLYVFIDHLDRCPIDDAVVVLDALRLHLDIPGCVVLIALDPDALREPAEAEPAWRETRPAAVLERVIDLPFRLPALSRQQITTLVESWCEAIGDGQLAVVTPLLAAGALPNPRRIKRLLGALRLLEKLGLGEQLGFFAKLLAIKATDPGLYRAVVAMPAHLKELEKAARDGALAEGDGLLGREARRLSAMLAQKPWFEPLAEQQLAELVTVNETVA